MTDVDVHGPVDIVLIEFPEERLTGRGAEELLSLVDRGLIRIFDVLVVGKSAEGETYSVDLAQVAAEQLGGFADLAWARSGLLSDEEMYEAAGAMQPGRLAVLVVFENTWAVPFVAAARESGGEMIATRRIPAQDVMDALSAMESRDELAPTS